MSVIPLFLLAALTALGSVYGMPIYTDPSKPNGGADARQDLYEVTDHRFLELADSTLALIQDKEVTFKGNLAFLDNSRYGEDRKLCSSERFYNQPDTAFCSGSLVASDVVMTAGHCLSPAEEAPLPSEALPPSSGGTPSPPGGSEPPQPKSPSPLEICQKTKFVFGYSVKEKDRFPEAVPKNEVYDCAGIIAASPKQEQDKEDGEDWVLIRLDRKVPNHAPLEINAAGSVRDGDPVVVIGHPAGLPTKVAGGVVLDASSKGVFTAILDAYGGNSGSPVFSLKTGLIEGVLDSGEEDFILKDGCNVSRVCAPKECDGESVTRISLLAALIAKERDRDVPAPAFSAERARAAISNLGVCPENSPPCGADFDATRIHP